MVTALYADTSAIVRSYLADEPEHAALRKLLLSGENQVLTSELTRLEFASAITAARRAGRIPDAQDYLDRFDRDGGKRIGLIPLEPRRIFPAVRRLVTENYPLRTLDAIHLAVAMHETVELTDGKPVIMVTRDQHQADAAKANGLAVL
jgi:predicted nucleic acid-binding protein